MEKKVVEHVALLASLSLSQKEIKKFQKQLTDILAYIGQLEELKTQAVEPTSQVTGLKNVFREDESRPSLSQDEVLSGTKKVHNGMFKTKAIFE